MSSTRSSVIRNSLLERKYELFSLLMTSLIMLLLAYHISEKLLAYLPFSFQLSLLPYLGDYWKLLAWIIPIANTIILCVLFFPRTRKTGLYIFIGYLGIVTVYLTAMVFTQHHLPCSCVGLSTEVTWMQHIYLNLGLTVMALLAAKFYPKKNG